MIKKLFYFFAKKDLTRSLKMNYNYYNGGVLLKKKKKIDPSSLSLIQLQIPAPT